MLERVRLIPFDPQVVDEGLDLREYADVLAGGFVEHVGVYGAVIDESGGHVPIRHDHSQQAAGFGIHHGGFDVFDKYGISVDDKNRIIVDRAKQFEEKNWEDEGAFLNVT